MRKGAAPIGRPRKAPRGVIGKSTAPPVSATAAPDPTALLLSRARELPGAMSLGAAVKTIARGDAVLAQSLAEVRADAPPPPNAARDAAEETLLKLAETIRKDRDIATSPACESCWAE